MKRCPVLLAALALILILSVALVTAAASSKPPEMPDLPFLGSGDSVTATIQARPRWNCTGIRLKKGTTYSITAEGTWWDAKYKHDPDGHPSQSTILRMWEWARRMRHENWFKLICAQDYDNQTAFPVGRHRQFVAARDGELTCFANDVWIMYWNNTGCIQMTVKGVP